METSLEFLKRIRDHLADCEIAIEREFGAGIFTKEQMTVLGKWSPEYVELCRIIDWVSER